MIARFSCTILVIISSLSAVPIEVAPGRWKLRTEELVRTDRTLVVKLSVEAPKLKAADRTTLVFGLPGKTNYSLSNRMWHTADGQRFG